MSGQPIIRGTRILPDPVLRSFDRGETLDDIREAWPSLSVDQINALIACAHAQRGNPRTEAETARLIPLDSKAK